MYVCVCHGITDRQIRRAVDQGARTLSDVQVRLPVGSCCGCCEEATRDVIEEHTAKKNCCRASGTAAAFA